jgi:hypothetical protein
MEVLKMTQYTRIQDKQKAEARKMAGNFVTLAQIARAKEIGIEEYILAHEPNNVKRVGSAYYLKDHDSLEIGNGLWNWHSQGVGGKNCIDYLIKVRGYGFVDAVRCLAGEDYGLNIAPAPKARPPTVSKSERERAAFRLPLRNADNDRVIAYLQSRGIDRDLILDCIKRGALYETAAWLNCCFVGRDENGKARYATLRGTLGDFKRDADGSNKCFGFRLPPDNPQSNTLHVFESPVDLLSFDTLRKLGHIDPKDAQDDWRLSLGGTSPAALTEFLGRHPEIAHCVVCTDRDTAGDLAFSEIAEKLTIKVSRLIPVGKDWNETLQQIRKEVKPLEDVRKDIRFINSRCDTLFTVKDGDSIKFTAGYDGEVKNLKARWIDDAHIQLIGKYQNDYHIRQFAEIMEENSSKYEPIPGQKPTIDVIAAKYGDSLTDTTIPMTDAAMQRLVGGKYKTEPLYVDGQGINGNYGPQIRAMLIRGKDGIAVCGVGGNGNALTSLHPYWAQKYKREMGVIKKPSLLGNLETKKAVAADRKANTEPAQIRRESGLEVG